MGWGLKVPDGWTRGEPIYFMGTGPRYACGRDITAYPIGHFAASKEFMIEFDTRAEAEAFRNWWRSPETTHEGTP